MLNLFRPYLYGVSSAAIVALGLWLAVPLVLLALTNSPSLWFPAWIVLPPLLVGGYVSAMQMRSRYTSRYLVMGGLVGISFMLVALLLSETSGAVWFSILIVFAGGAVSMLGAFVGKKSTAKV